MSLILKDQKFLCLQHQEKFTAGELLWVWLEGPPKKMCPRCVEEMNDAKFAEDVQETTLCVIHAGEPEGWKAKAAVGQCSLCGLAFCGDCLKGNGICIFCSPTPKSN